MTPTLQNETEQTKEQHLGQNHCWATDPGRGTPCATVLFPGHTVSPLNISLQVLGGSAALLKCSFSFLRQTKITVSSCREKQPADSSLCTLQQQRPVMQSLLERGKKNLGKLPMIQADSQFLMIQRKAFFNGLKNILCGKSLSVGSSKDLLRQCHTEMDTAGREQ